METFPTLPSLCAGNSLVTGELPAQRDSNAEFDISFDVLRLMIRLNKRLNRRWFETPWRSSWRYCNALLSFHSFYMNLRSIHAGYTQQLVRKLRIRIQITFRARFLSVAEQGLNQGRENLYTESERSSKWLSSSSLGTLKLVFSVSSNDQGSHPDDLCISVCNVFSYLPRHRSVIHIKSKWHHKLHVLKTNSVITVDSVYGVLKQISV